MSLTRQLVKPKAKTYRKIFALIGIALMGLGSVWVALAAGCAAAAMAGTVDELIDRALRGDTPAVQALLANGTDVNAKDRMGRTALMEASRSGRREVVQALLANGADVNA